MAFQFGKAQFMGPVFLGFLYHILFHTSLLHIDQNWWANFKTHVHCIFDGSCGHISDKDRPRIRLYFNSFFATGL